MQLANCMCLCLSWLCPQQTACDTLGYVKKNLIGNNVNILMPQPFTKAHEQYLERYTKTGGWVGGSCKERGAWG